MKLIEQILNQLGADGLNAITLVPCSCCYLKNIKTITDFSTQRISMKTGKKNVVVEGENLQVGEYFEGDLIIKGDVRAVKIE